MARVTVTDCLENVDNRFQLVLIAAKRARQLAMGAKALVEEDGDKPTVIALREIADGFVDETILESDNTGFFLQDDEVEDEAEVASEFEQDIDQLLKQELGMLMGAEPTSPAMIEAADDLGDTLNEALGDAPSEILGDTPSELIGDVAGESEKDNT